MMDTMIKRGEKPNMKGDGVHEIHAHESQRKYRLVGLDNNEIERTAEELFQGSNLLSNQTLWVSNFKTTVSQVREWCKARETTIRRVLVDVKSSKVILYFVPESSRYDISLGGEMTELEVGLGAAGIGHVETLQVPERSLDRFVGRGSAEIWRRPH